MEEYKNNYEKSLALSKIGIRPKTIHWYWVDLKVYGLTDKELMIASEAEHRHNETKGIAFIDFDTTIPAFSNEDIMIAVKENVEAYALIITEFGAPDRYETYYNNPIIYTKPEQNHE